MIRLRSLPACMALTAALISVALPAMAEGSFTSSMSGWLTGLETRDWDDRDSDNASTTFEAKKCSYSSGLATKSITMELNRNDTLTPDEHYGDKAVPCTPTSSLNKVSWGDKGKGNFDMTLKKIDGSVTSTKGKLNVEYLKIGY